MKPKYIVPQKNLLPKDFNNKLLFKNYIKNNNSYSSNKFSFLNLEYEFSKKIDWNYSNHGKLFTYNLNYFDFLNQDNISKDQGISLLLMYFKEYKSLKDGFEPYPTSIRIINMIKFLGENDLSIDFIDDMISKDYARLENNIEYHLLGNHLLENYFALFFGSVFLKKNISKYKKLLFKELEEQILKDGGHYERSPMYHQLILYRLLDLIQLISLNSLDENIHLEFRKVASKMIAWLKNITFNNGEIPLFNDSTNGVNPKTMELVDYAEYMNINNVHISLDDSDFRILENSKFECIVNVGNIKAKYQPGHAHADHGTFELHYLNQPIIVDTGISTYEKNSRRNYERSTLAHNTVSIYDESSSDVWSGFRVGRRAQAKIEIDNSRQLKISHDGYSHYRVIHKREFSIIKNDIVIKDIINKDGISAKSRLHIHPSQRILSCDDNKVQFSDFTIYFKGGKASINEYKYCPEFNFKISSESLDVTFNGELETLISFNIN